MAFGATAPAHSTSSKASFALSPSSTKTEGSNAGTRIVLTAPPKRMQVPLLPDDGRADSDPMEAHGSLKVWRKDTTSDMLSFARPTIAMVVPVPLISLSQSGCAL